MVSALQSYRSGLSRLSSADAKHTVIAKLPKPTRVEKNRKAMWHSAISEEDEEAKNGPGRSQTSTYCCQRHDDTKEATPHP